jgi:hypothetical protein
MRNLVLAEEIRRSEGLQTAFVIVYADHPSLSYSQKVSSHGDRANQDWNEFKSTLRAGAALLHTISYQELLAIAVGAAGESSAKWSDLQSWVARKVRTVGELHQPSPAGSASSHTG